MQSNNSIWNVKSKSHGKHGRSVLTVSLTAAVLALASPTFAAAQNGNAPAPVATLPQTGPAAAEAAKKLNKSEFKNVQVTVENGIATLTGSVDIYQQKADAEKRLHKVDGITAVRNLIQVGGPVVADDRLQAKLREKLSYDRAEQGNLFDAITLNVQNGVVTLAGHAHNWTDKNSALTLVSYYPGVKDVIDQVQVDPVSGFDEQTRFAVARAIYDYPSLNKYAADPAKPIRISVQNGHVELEGVVLSKADKEVAYLRANAVPGVFSVVNNLQVANDYDKEKPTSN